MGNVRETHRAATKSVRSWVELLASIHRRLYLEKKTTMGRTHSLWFLLITAIIITRFFVVFFSFLVISFVFFYFSDTVAGKVRVVCIMITRQTRSEKPTKQNDSTNVREVKLKQEPLVRHGWRAAERASGTAPLSGQSVDVGPPIPSKDRSSSDSTVQEPKKFCLCCRR